MSYIYTYIMEYIISSLDNSQYCLNTIQHISSNYDIPKGKSPKMKSPKVKSPKVKVKIEQ